MTVAEWEWDILEKMIIKHDLDIDMKELPETGKIVWNNSVPVAAGFLRICEGSVGILDSIITNPECSKKDRNDALNLIYKSFIKEAKDIGLLKLIGFTIDNTIVERSKRFGFKESEYKLLTLSLGE